MKERPIIFSGPETRAILQGRKTVTRRVVKPSSKPRPVAVHGDRLWVRETWAGADQMYKADESDPPEVIAYFADRSAIQYDASPPRQIPSWDLATWNWDSLRKRPSIFMPRWASRLTLEVVNVRVERLQEISKQDVIAEGCRLPVSQEGRPLLRIPNPYRKTGPFEDWNEDDFWRAEYACLWDSINGKRAPWESNPLVWVVEFRRTK